MLSIVGFMRPGKSPVEKYLRPLLAVFAAGFFFVDLVRLYAAGPGLDEIEHVHVAWLMAHGHRPYVDFFEHHMPGLWQMLAVWCVAFPKDGAEILYWGRFLCALSLTVSSWLVYKIAARDRPRETGWLAVMLWLVVANRCSAVSIRPEMLACPVLLASLFCLQERIDAPKERGLLLLSGLLSGGACYFTPRAVFFAAGLFLSQVRRLNGKERLSWLGCAAVGPALAVSWIGWPDFQKWLIDFNHHTGTYPHRFLMVSAWDFGGILAAALLVSILHVFWKKDRKTIELGFIYALALVSPLLIERAPFQQGFACVMPLAVILLARHISFLFELSPALRRAALLELALLWIWPCGLGRTALTPPLHEELAADVRHRVALAGQLGDETVLVGIADHPVACLDGSYYWLHLFAFRPAHFKNMRFDFLDDLRTHRPALISTGGLEDMGERAPEQALALKDYVRRHYDRYPERELLVRKDLAPTEALAQRFPLRGRP